MRMIKLHRSVRPGRTRSLGVECLEGRAVLSGASHAAAVIAHQHAVGAATAKETALLPPAMIKSYFQQSGDTVTGLVMVFSKPLDPATAQNVNNYQISGSLKTPTSYTGFPVGASAAVYDPSQDSVTLVLAQPFKLSPAPIKDDFSVGLTPGSTLTDTSGNVLIYGKPFRFFGKPTLVNSTLAE